MIMRLPFNIFKTFSSKDERISKLQRCWIEIKTEDMIVFI